MRTLLLFAVLAIMVSNRAAFGQESEPAATMPAAEAPDSDAAAAGLTLEELVERAFQHLKMAEARGPDANAALEQANRLVSAIRRRDPLNADADFLAGRANLLLGRPREAIGAIDRYVKSRKGENDWLAFKMLGDLYFDARYYTMARDKYQRAIDLSPREPDPYAGMAETEMRLSRPRKAEEYANMAIERDTATTPAERKPQYYGVLAAALLGNRKPDEAAEAATTAVELARESAKNSPTDPALLTELDAHNERLESIIKAIIVSYPERSEEFAALARVQTERAEIAHLLSLHGVLATLTKGIARAGSPPPPVLVVEQARLLLAVGDVDEAAQALADLLVGDPDNAEAQRLLGEIEGTRSPTPASP